MSELITAMAESIKSGAPLPPMPKDLDLDAAYEIQRQVVEAVAGDAIAGYKAGLTAPAGQQQFGLDHPLIGVLYQAGRLEPGASFASAPGVSLECEIGVVIDADGSPRSAGPVIEVPRMAFGDPADRTGMNLTACNIAADRFIVGQQADIRDSYDDIEVTLTRNGETVASASATEALGGPIPALNWMLETARERGREMADGMLMITGALGGIHPAEPGEYVADYGTLGQISFTVT